MNGLEFARGWLWPALLGLPIVWALLWALFDRTRRAAVRYGATSTDAVAGPLLRSLGLSTLLGLGVLCWMDPRLGDEPVQVERRGLDLIFCPRRARECALARQQRVSHWSEATATVRRNGCFTCCRCQPTRA